jgi:hypothetical protein
MELYFFIITLKSLLLHLTFLKNFPHLFFLLTHQYLAQIKYL